LRRNHVGAIVAVCVACDWVLITLGAIGFGSVVGAFPAVTAVAAWAGAAFLLLFGAMSLRSAAHPAVLSPEDPSRREAPSSTRAAVLATLGVSLLNPHVYLDTVVLIGSVAAQYGFSARAWFAAGAGLASLVWFTGLGLGARLLAPLFSKPAAWRVLDVLITAIMWWIAVSLVIGQLR
jgi:L-lysine exporter family protein LysE/ArgO